MAALNEIWNEPCIVCIHGHLFFLCIWKKRPFLLYFRTALRASLDHRKSKQAMTHWLSIRSSIYFRVIPSWYDITLALISRSIWIRTTDWLIREVRSDRQSGRAWTWGRERRPATPNGRFTQATAEGDACDQRSLAGVVVRGEAEAEACSGVRRCLAGGVGILHRHCKA